MTKPKLILLHGALGSKTQFDHLLPELNLHFETACFNFSGHGGNSADMPFRISLFVNDLHDFLKSEGIEHPNIFGYSMGGYVALAHELKYPGLISHLVTLGTKFEWTAESAAREVKMLNPEKILEKVPKFGAVLEKRHSPEDWKKVMTQTAEMMLDLGNGSAMTMDQLGKIQTRVRVCLGSEDNMVSKAESELAAVSLEKGSFKLLPGQAHPIEKVDPKLLSNVIRDFLIPAL